MSSFLEDLALYKKLNGNCVRTALLVYDKELRQKDIVKLTRWDRANVSRCLRTLTMYGIVLKREKEAGTYYRANKNWRMPDVAGQLVMNLT